MNWNAAEFGISVHASVKVERPHSPNHHYTLRARRSAAHEGDNRWEWSKTIDSSPGRPHGKRVSVNGHMGGAGVECI